MNEIQRTFTPDLRYPREYQKTGIDKWSQWSSLAMIEMSAQETYQFVKGMIERPAQKILEVGCGNGYLSLELARDGHDVVGLDISTEIIELAEETRAAHPDTPGFGRLAYFCEDVDSWSQTGTRFDVVLFNRTLHHLTDLPAKIEKVKRLLKSGGYIICQDYAYDRLNDQTASWMYAMQRLLFLSGHYREDPLTETDDASSIKMLRHAWHQRAVSHALNRYEDMVRVLQTSFHQHFFAWVPYLFIYIGNGISSVSPEQERAMIPFLKNMEQLLIEKESFQAVGFRYVGML